MKDYTRTFPAHPYFAPAESRLPTPDTPMTSREIEEAASLLPELPYLAAMRRVLTVFAHAHPAISYCQGINYVAAALLIYATTGTEEVDEEAEELAFDLMCALLPSLPDYHGANLLGFQVDTCVLRHLLKLRAPALHAKLVDADLPLDMVVTPWLITLFTSVLPLETTARMLDAFICITPLIFMRTALAMFFVLAPSILAAQSRSELMAILKNGPASWYDADELIATAFSSVCDLDRPSLEEYRDKARDLITADPHGWAGAEHAVVGPRGARVAALRRSIDALEGEVSLSAGDSQYVVSDASPALIEVCQALEAILKHGFKTRSSSLFRSSTRDYWSFLSTLKKYHPHATEMVKSIASMSEVSTPLGRGRAWIRAALVQARLDEYLITLLNNTNLIKEYYTPQALLQSHKDVMDILQCLARLSPIPFALCAKDVSLDLSWRPRAGLITPVPTSRPQSPGPSASSLSSFSSSYPPTFPSSSSSSSSTPSTTSTLSTPSTPSRHGRHRALQVMDSLFDEEGESDAGAKSVQVSHPHQQQSTRCPLCNERFTQPKLLLCLHSFCAVCLIQIAAAASRASENNLIQHLSCPLCRELTPIPPPIRREELQEPLEALLLPRHHRSVLLSGGGGSSGGGGGNGGGKGGGVAVLLEQDGLARESVFKQDLRIAVLMGDLDTATALGCAAVLALSTDYTLERTIQGKCSQCDEWEGALECTSCGVRFCKLHARVHHKITLLSHALVVAGPPSPLPVLCPFHPREELDLFCTACQMSVCAACLDQYGSSHVGHDVLPVDAQASVLSSELESFVDQTGTKLEALESRLPSAQEEAAMLASARANIEDSFGEIMAALEAKKAAMLGALDQVARVSSQERASVGLPPEPYPALATARDSMARTHTLLSAMRDSSSPAEVAAIRPLLVERVMALSGEGGGVVEVEEVGVEVGRDVVEGWASGVDVAPVLDALSAIAPME